MKKLPRTLMIFVMFSFFYNTNCRKNEAPTPDNPYGLPNATQDGANIFAFRMNGNNWIAHLRQYNPTPPVEYNGYIFNIYGEAAIGKFGYAIDLNISGGIKSNTTYSLTDSAHTLCTAWTNNICTTAHSSIFNDTRTGSITVTKLDTVNEIVSGTFWFKMPIPTCDSIIVSDGRFDCSYGNW